MDMDILLAFRLGRASCRLRLCTKHLAEGIFDLIPRTAVYIATADGTPERHLGLAVIDEDLVPFLDVTCETDRHGIGLCGVHIMLGVGTRSASMVEMTPQPEDKSVCLPTVPETVILDEVFQLLARRGTGVLVQREMLQPGERIPKGCSTLWLEFAP